MSTCKPVALSAFFSLALGLVSACGDDGGSAQVDARSVIDAAGQIDSAVGAPDADPNAPDAAPVGLPDANLSAPDAMPMVMSGVIINEMLLDEAGNDKDEFVELKGDPNTDYSGLTILQVDGDVGMNLNPGVVVTSHAGCTTDANGYCAITVNNNSFQNGSQTMLLVQGGTYVDGTTDLDTNDDGNIDNTPWTTLLDGAAIVNTGTDFGYAGNTVMLKTVSGGGNSQPLTFGGASRIPDGTDTNTAADWTSNTPNFDNTGIANGEAHNTPGAANTILIP